MTPTHECRYCARYAVNQYTGTPTGSPRFTGTYAEVVTHADVHPVGSPLDAVMRLDPAD